MVAIFSAHDLFRVILELLQGSNLFMSPQRGIDLECKAEEVTDGRVVGAGVSVT